MKRVLLVSYAFPPEPLPGALRPGYLARYLPQYGWHVTVLTHTPERPPFQADVVRAGFARRALTAGRAGSVVPRGGRTHAMLRSIKDALVFPDEMAPWIAPAIASGVRLMDARHFDAVLSTALPTSAHLVAGTLARLRRVPWIADYRDLWSGNPYMPWGPLKARLQRFTERFTLQAASHITTVSHALAADLRGLHGERVTVIENAYDAAEWGAVPQQDPAAFDLVYTGTLYGGKRSPDSLLRALAHLREAGHPLAREVRLHFYGPGNETAALRAAECGLTDCVHVHGTVPREAAMRAQRAAAGLLIFLSMDPATADERGSKYLEYLGAQRPMIVFGPAKSIMRETVRQLNAGFFASSAEEAAQALCALHERFLNRQYRPALNLQSVQTAEALARDFAQCLDNALPAPQTRLTETLPPLFD